MAGLAIGAFGGLAGATQFLGWTFAYAPALGAGLQMGEAVLYPPWAAATWRARFGDQAPEAFSAANGLLVLGLAGGAGLAVLLDGSAVSARRRRGWGGLRDLRAAGLLDGEGCVLGAYRGRLLATRDMRPTLVTGGTRSGKGRGHVVPTLLSWGASVIVHDPKGELWRVSAGWRAGFSHVLRFAPRDLHSARWNPLAAIEPGPAELAQVQRLVAILSDPGGARQDEAIWDKAASEILEAVILHVLYTADDGAKSLLTVRDLLADLDATAEDMGRTLHQKDGDGALTTHRFIANAAHGYLAMHDRFRTSVQGTARAYLKWLAGEDVDRSLSGSDFDIADLACAKAPVSLYVEIAPADAVALRPLTRLFFQAATQALTVSETADARGRPKRHRLLLLMDEFPLLGRLDFFEKSLRLMSGYGLKTMFVAQSLNDILETYGRHNTILDNCHAYTAFSALDPATQDIVSRLTGLVDEPRISHSHPIGLARGRASTTRSWADRPLLEPGEIRALPDDVQLIFVTGQRPIRAKKIRYDGREPFRSRAGLAPPDPAGGVDSPGVPPHPWAGRRALGQARPERSTATPTPAPGLSAEQIARMAAIQDEVLADYAAEEAVLDHLQGRRP